MTPFKSLAALTLLGAALTACTPDGRPTSASQANRGLESANQPVVQRTDYVLDVAGENGLSALERGRLNAWFESLGLGYGDRIFVEEAYGPSRTREDVARAASAYGLLLSDGAPVTAGRVQPGFARVVVSRSTAHVPNCPNWEGPGGPSSTSSNYGCAVNSNLAAMIADPNDLVLGRSGQGGNRDGLITRKAIKVYREAPPTGTKGLDQVTSRGSK